MDFAMHLDFGAVEILDGFSIQAIPLGSVGLEFYNTCLLPFNYGT